jgi:hypothetical protein
MYAISSGRVFESNTISGISDPICNETCYTDVTGLSRCVVIFVATSYLSQILAIKSSMSPRKAAPPENASAPATRRCLRRQIDPFTKSIPPQICQLNSDSDLYTFSSAGIIERRIDLCPEASSRARASHQSGVPPVGSYSRASPRSLGSSPISGDSAPFTRCLVALTFHPSEKIRVYSGRNPHDD